MAHGQRVSWRMSSGSARNLPPSRVRDCRVLDLEPSPLLRAGHKIDEVEGVEVNALPSTRRSRHRRRPRAGRRHLGTRPPRYGHVCDGDGRRECNAGQDRANPRSAGARSANTPCRIEPITGGDKTESSAKQMSMIQGARADGRRPGPQALGNTHGPMGRAAVSQRCATRVLEDALATLHSEDSSCLGCSHQDVGALLGRCDAQSDEKIRHALWDEYLSRTDEIRWAAVAPFSGLRGARLLSANSPNMQPGVVGPQGP